MLSPIVSQTDPIESSDFALVFSPPTGGLMLFSEQVQENECNYRFRPFIKATNHSTGKAVIFKPRCKLWSCPVCGPINARKVIALAHHAALNLLEQGRPLNMVTVTSHEKASAGATVRYLPENWKKLRERLFYVAGSPEYLVIPERHKDRRLHLHLLVTANLGQKWWKDNARSCGMGYMARDKPCYSAAGAADYATKYMGKSLQFTNWAKGFHRYRTTQGWPKLPALPDPPGWNFTLLSRDHVLSEEIEHLMSINYVVAVLDHTQAWEFVNLPE